MVWKWCLGVRGESNKAKRKYLIKRIQTQIQDLELRRSARGLASSIFAPLEIEAGVALKITQDSSKSFSSI